MKAFFHPGLIDEFIDLPVIDSTNRYALDTARKGLLVRAGRQTAGRGRRGRTWFSPEGQNLYMTITLSQPEERYPLLAGVAVRAGLSALLGGRNLEIKWPNDIIFSGRKVCGILCETRGPITAVGIGINVNQNTWPEDITDKAISLYEIAAVRFDLDDVTETVVSHFVHWIKRFGESGFAPVRKELIKHGLLRGYNLSTEDNQRCTIKDIDMNGHLIIDVSGVTRSLHYETIYLSG
jgi:BirA family transcriptional regulator, biotin operon repressor / biotin---[acetyl-CoA-carboxylase] ligase